MCYNWLEAYGPRRMKYILFQHDKKGVIKLIWEIGTIKHNNVKEFNFYLNFHFLKRQKYVLIL